VFGGPLQAIEMVASRTATTVQGVMTASLGPYARLRADRVGLRAAVSSADFIALLYAGDAGRQVRVLGTRRRDTVAAQRKSSMLSLANDGRRTKSALARSLDAGLVHGRKDI
jgi:hypothetical protein